MSRIDKLLEDCSGFFPYLDYVDIPRFKKNINDSIEMIIEQKYQSLNPKEKYIEIVKHAYKKLTRSNEYGICEIIHADISIDMNAEYPLYINMNDLAELSNDDVLKQLNDFQSESDCYQDVFFESLESIYDSSEIVIGRLISDHFMHEKHVSWNNIHSEIIYKYPNGVGYLESKAHFVSVNNEKND